MVPRPIALALLTLLACRSGTTQSANAALDAYLSQYGHEYQRLYYESDLAEWESNTRIVEGDSTNSVRTRRANEALARFVGSNDNIARIQGYLRDRDRLSPVQARQLDAMLYLAAEKPASAAAVVAERIAAEAAQTEKLYGFQFRLNRRPITANAIDDYPAHQPPAPGAARRLGSLESSGSGRSSRECCASGSCAMRW